MEDHYPQQLAISPNGRTLATIGGGVGDSSWDPTVVLWQIPSGRVLRAIRGRFIMTGTGAFAPDSRRLAVTVGYGSGPGPVLIWDLRSRDQPQAWPGAGTSENLCFRPDGTLLAWERATLALEAFDPGSQKQTTAWLPRGFGSLSPAAFSADCDQFALGQGAVVRVWDTRTRP